MNDRDVLQCLDKLERTVFGDECTVDIKNVIRKYAMYFHSGDCRGILSCFASERSDVEIVFGNSKLCGIAAVRDFYAARPMLVRLPGTVVTHEISTEVVAVAGDGKTARVTAYATGLKGLAPVKSQVNLLGKYYFDLVREDGGWKIWHLQWVLIADADFNYGWLFQNRAYYIEDDYPALSEEPRPGMPLQAADAYMDYFKPDEIQVLLPEPPQEYESWDGYKAAMNTRGYE